MPVYLDCAASTPIDPAVLDVCLHYLRDDFGNAASRTHTYGAATRPGNLAEVRALFEIACGYHH